MKEFISGAELKSMYISAAAAVDNAKQEINDLNVFPVPDGDTGTNMALTLGNAAKELGKEPDTVAVGRCTAVAASAMLRGARGNSGVITSLLFRGFSKYLKENDTADGRDFALALTSGVEAAYKSVMKPTEGTILTVSRMAAEAAIRTAENENDLDSVLDAAIAAATDALAKTIDQNPVLKKAGVVDAGGKGFVLILDAMRAAMNGNAVTALNAADSAATEAKERATFSDFDEEDITFSYCTEFIVARDNDRDPAIMRDILNNMGDSLVFVEDDDIIKVHVHTDNPGTAMQEALKYGALQTVKVENMRLQHTERIITEQEKENNSEPVRKIAPPEKRYGIVSVCAGDGIAEIFREMGADHMVSGGQTMNPSTDDILKMVDATPAEVVIILPNNKNIIMAAEQCKPLSDKQVVVVPTTSIPQGITAMLTIDFNEEVEANIEAIQEAISNVTTMQITYAARNSDYDGHNISEGDFLALSNNALFATERDITVLLTKLAVEAKTIGAEFITIFYGQDITKEDADSAAEIFAGICPDADINLISGGQPVYYYLISVE